MDIKIKGLIIIVIVLIGAVGVTSAMLLQKNNVTSNISTNNTTNISNNNTIPINNTKTVTSNNKIIAKNNTSTTTLTKGEAITDVKNAISYPSTYTYTATLTGNHYVVVVSDVNGNTMATLTVSMNGQID